jgi:hypothetical protein
MVTTTGARATSDGTARRRGVVSTIVRVETVLAPGQSVVLSAPREAGAAPETVEISRQANAALVRKAAEATN